VIDAMRDATKLIEIAAPKNGAMPVDYGVAQGLAQEGCSSEAERIYWRILADMTSTRVQSTVYNDLAAIAATASDTQKARELLEKALSIDPQCEAARDNWAALGLSSPPGVGPSNAGPRRRVKLVIVSGLFNWPSGGGGNVHTVQLAMALERADCEVHHLFLEYEPWLIGRVEGNSIESQPIRFRESEWSLAEVQSRIRAAVRAHSPDYVLLTDCWSLKPWLAKAVSEVPYLLRFDGMECLCPLNNLRVIPHPNRYIEPCTKHRLATPEWCLKCVQEYSQFAGQRHVWEREFSQFQTREYHELLEWALANAAAVLVLNPLIAAALEPYAATVRVVPNGVDARTFGQVPALSADGSDGIKWIVFGGRTHDPVKGFQILRAAGERLWRDRQDFRIIATEDENGSDSPFIKSRGWQSHADMPALLAIADILAAPAVASEPFGLTVVEAMAAARPVVASRVGGQQFTVVDGLTGLLCQPDDPSDLAVKLIELLDSAKLRMAMGNAGRRRFLSEYAWDVVIDRYYAPLLKLGSRK
jgi:glycosyltransferase involved in cell wall biosynthesis